MFFSASILFVCLQIWGLVQHEVVQALDEKLEQTLVSKPYFLNLQHLLLCLQIWGSVQHKGEQALATLDEKLEQTLNTKLA